MVCCDLVVVWFLFWFCWLVDLVGLWVYCILLLDVCLRYYMWFRFGCVFVWCVTCVDCVGWCCFGFAFWVGGWDVAVCCVVDGYMFFYYFLCCYYIESLGGLVVGWFGGWCLGLCLLIGCLGFVLGVEFAFVGLVGLLRCLI